MGKKKESLVKGAGLTLLPICTILPVLALARFGPLGPGNAWTIAVYAPLAMWMQLCAMRHLLNSYWKISDPTTLIIFPLGLASVVDYTFSGLLLILAIPALLQKLG